MGILDVTPTIPDVIDNVTAARINDAGSATSAALGTKYAAKSVETTKLDKTEAAATYATPATVSTQVAAEVPPHVSAYIANDPTVVDSAATMAQNTAGLIPVWKASTAYVAGQRVIAPNGDIVSAKVDFTSGASYSAANWNASTQDGRIAATETGVAAALKNLGTPANGTDVNTLQTTGYHTITSGAVANTLINLPVLYPGVLETFLPSTSVGYQRYTTFGTKGGASPNTGVWVRFRQSTTTWDRWWELGEAFLRGNIPTASPVDLNTFTTPGVFTVNNTTAVNNTTNLPAAFPGVLENLRTFGAVIAVQRYTVYGVNAAVYWRVSSDVSGNWTAWNRLDNQAAATPAVDTGAYEHLMRENDMRRRRFNRVTAPGVVVLVLDHGLTNFKSTIWPLLQARNIPVTIGLNPGQMADAQNSGATYADIQSWAATGLVEPANHSYNHVGGTTSAQFETEIRSSRVELETQLGQTIDTWVHPGNVFGDFTVTADKTLYWSTEAGRKILACHGAVTGLLDTGTLPIGVNSIGAAGLWIDNDASTVGVQTAVQNAITKQGIQIVRLHPQFLNDAGKLTTAELTSFLDWIASKVTAGDLKALTFRDAMSATR
ncbi:polysaccharide deacetylase family protein [Paenarthrobacter sp. R1]|uniref:polysaccharide deacetylase family protein n=1 Tax=Paenarthrobacter sp. R1 TaxID=3049085 RepID=UPI002557B5D2|nr:polysaccharide deacetylase family protein [Paenarthrobacter sp. R1]WIV32245.1 polysaccharide deacetylase family protein [Paenarthrobacter sp. R1]